MSQQYRQDNTIRPGTVPAHTVHGEPVHATMRPEAAAEGTALATQSMFRNYQPPKRRDRDNPDLVLCAADGCKAFPQEGKNYCTGHARAHGEAKVCAHRDCKAPPKKGQSYCRWHGMGVTDEPPGTD